MTSLVATVCQFKFYILKYKYNFFHQKSFITYFLHAHCYNDKYVVLWRLHVLQYIVNPILFMSKEHADKRHFSNFRFARMKHTDRCRTREHEDNKFLEEHTDLLL